MDYRNAVDIKTWNPQNHQDLLYVQQRAFFFGYPYRIHGAGRPFHGLTLGNLVG